MSTERTPGRWQVEEYAPAQAWVVTTDAWPEKDEKGYAGNVVFDGIYNRADAVLGAAAKDVLDALEAVLNCVSTNERPCSDCKRLARAAVARAHGRTP